MTAIKPAKAQEVHWPGGGSLLDGIPDGWYSRKQAAEKIGRDKDTLKRWQRDGIYEPSGYQERGTLIMWLYSDADIENMKAIAGAMKTGPKPKQPEEEDAEGS